MNNKRLRKYGLIVAFMIIIFLLLGLLIWKSIGINRGAELYPITWFIIAASVTGSLLNQPFRNESAQPSSIGQILIYVIWKCSVAIALSVTLYMIFAAELINGEMFPRFINNRAENGGGYISMVEFMTKMKPESYQDVAKILVWSFISGYSEKFVPNLILQITKGADNENKHD
jgi:hypothetical protein